MKAFIASILVVTTSTQALADGDAPYAEIVTKGQETPFSGLLLSESAAIETAKRIKSCEAKVPVLEDAVKTQIPVWVPIVVGVLAASAGVGVTLAVVNAK